MSDRGGRGARGLSVAAALALLVLPALLAPTPFLAPASAQSVADPWWGPTDRSNPTKGWAVRVPVVVTNDDPVDTVTDRLVAVDLDLGKLLVQAGWTNETKGASHRPRGFTLDVDSIRVVEYTSGFGQGPLEGVDTQPVPHHFYTAMWRAERYQEFDPRDPAGTVLFLVQGAIPPGAKRYFYIYANPLEYGDLPPATFTLAQRAPLDAYLWGSRGTVVYGYEPGGQTGRGHLIHIGSMSLQRASVTVYELTPGSGRFTPVPSTATQENPFILPSFGMRDVFIQGGRPYKIVSDREISVYATGQPHSSGAITCAPGDAQCTAGSGPPMQTETFGYAPADNGTYTGKVFRVWGARQDGPQPNTGLVWVIAAKQRSTTVTASSGISQNTVTLTPANPVQPIVVGYNTWSTIVASEEIMVSYSPPRITSNQPQHTVQIPSLTGGPVGVDFFSPLTLDRGVFRACAEENSSVRIVSMGSGRNNQLTPQGSIDSVPPHIVPRGRFCQSVEAPLGTPTDHWEWYAEDRYPTPHPPVPFRLYTGAPVRTSPTLDRDAVGFYGGPAATDFQVFGPTGVFAHFNHTRVTIHEEKTDLLPDGTRASSNRTVTLSADQFFAISPSAKSTGALRIVSQKPISVVATDEVALYDLKPDGTLERNGDSHSYVMYVPGRPADLKTTVGAAEFRGPLVDLRATDTAARIVTLSTGPGTPVTFRLDALNLGRWLAGERLSDSITVRCTGPAGWKIEDCDRTLEVAGGQAERLAIRITPPADETTASQTIFVEARSRTPGVNSTFRLGVIVEVRYGVGLWLGAVGGEKRVDPPVGLDPGETHTYRLWIKNLGSTRDTFALTLDAARTGWTQELTLGTEPVKRVALDPGEAKELLLRVTAPQAETAPSNDVSILAVSETAANAGDQVNTVTRIRPKVNVKMTVDPQTQLAAPDEAVRFNVTLNNSGNDVFRVVLRQEATRLWPAHLEQTDVYVNPGDVLTLGLRVTPPSDARAGDLASVKLTADVFTGGATSVVGDQVSAVTVVRRVHNLTLPAVPEARGEPGATIRYSLPVQNLGNGQDVVELLPQAVTAGWSLVLDPATITVPYNETAELPLTIGVPSGLAEGTYNLTFTTRLSRETFQNLTIPVQVLRVAKVAFEGERTLATSQGRATSLPLVARNVGNVPGVFVLGADAPPSWNVTFSPDRVRLEPGSALPVTLTLNASPEASDGLTQVALTARVGDEPAGSTPLSVELAKPLLSISKVDASGRLVRGELVVVAATVRNTGKLVAEDVDVALVVDGRIVDRTTLSRIPINQSAEATLSWVATSRGGDVRVVVDPEQEIAQVSRDETAAAVAFGSRVPGPGLVLLVALAGVALFLRRRDA